jgi:hypothetical protein
MLDTPCIPILLASATEPTEVISLMLQLSSNSCKAHASGQLSLALPVAALNRQSIVTGTRQLVSHGLL